MSPKVYILLLNYNGWEDTLECLESILNNKYDNFQIVVVDNCSPNNSMDYMLEWANGKRKASLKNDAFKTVLPDLTLRSTAHIFLDPKILFNKNHIQTSDIVNQPKIIFIQSGENRGFSAGNNVGLKFILEQGDADFVWLLNNDTVIEPDAITKLIQNACAQQSRDVRIGLWGTKLFYYYSPDKFQGVGGILNPFFATTKHLGENMSDRGQFDNEKAVLSSIDYPIGASMLVSKYYLQYVGLLCEDYFLYYEELDWVLRGEKRGLTLGYCSNVRVYHKEGGSIGSNSDPKNKSELADFYGIRNRFVFCKKFMPEKLFFARLAFLGVILKRIFRCQFNRIPLALRAFWVHFKS